MIIPVVADNEDIVIKTYGQDRTQGEESWSEFGVDVSMINVVYLTHQSHSCRCHEQDPSKTLQVLLLLLLLLSQAGPKGSQDIWTGQDTRSRELERAWRRRFPDLSYGAEARSDTLSFWTRCCQLSCEEYGCNLEEEWCYLDFGPENLEEQNWRRF